MGKTVKLSCRLDEDLVQFLDREVEKKQSAGRRTDRTTEIAIAVRQRQISKLPEAQRMALLKKLKSAT